MQHYQSSECGCCDRKIKRLLLSRSVSYVHMCSVGQVGSNGSLAVPYAAGQTPTLRAWHSVLRPADIGWGMTVPGRPSKLTLDHRLRPWKSYQPHRYHSLSWFCRKAVLRAARQTATLFEATSSKPAIYLHGTHSSRQMVIHSWQYLSKVYKSSFRNRSTVR